MITVEKYLDIGIERDGVWHTRFTMRQATIADAITAAEKTPERSSSLTERIYKAAEQIEHIGDITEIDGELLLGLAADDIHPILKAQDEIVKKLKGLRKASSRTPILKSSSEDTGSKTQED